MGVGSKILSSNLPIRPIMGEFIAVVTSVPSPILWNEAYQMVLQLNLLTIMHIIASKTPWRIYSVTPTLKPDQRLLKDSETTKAGAAIMETPRSALLHIATPKATKIIPKSQRSSDDFLILFNITMSFFINSNKYIISQKG